MRLLIVEDEVGIANFLKQGLEEEGFTIDIAHSGNQGLSIALSGEYDLLILDWMLPGKSGLEVCQEFRKNFKHTPVIFLTAKDTIGETITALQIGANDYIKKPFHFEELLARIRVQLRSKEELEELTKLTLGNICINLEAHTVYKGEQEISLTQKEFALLELLIRNKEKVCSRILIIERVWDIHFDYNTGVIDVFINALRKKLKLSDSENYIQTVRGVGYMAREL